MCCSNIVKFSFELKNLLFVKWEIFNFIHILCVKQNMSCNKHAKMLTVNEHFHIIRNICMYSKSPLVRFYFLYFVVGFISISLGTEVFQCTSIVKKYITIFIICFTVKLSVMAGKSWCSCFVTENNEFFFMF